MTTKTTTARRTTTPTPRATSNDRTSRALRSAARWLKRRGTQRESREARKAYNDAAAVILNRVHR